MKTVKKKKCLRGRGRREPLCLFNFRASGQLLCCYVCVVKFLLTFFKFPKAAALGSGGRPPGPGPGLRRDGGPLLTPGGRRSRTGPAPRKSRRLFPSASPCVPVPEASGEAPGAWAASLSSRAPSELDGWDPGPGSELSLPLRIQPPGRLSCRRGQRERAQGWEPVACPQDQALWGRRSGQQRRRQRPLQDAPSSGRGSASRAVWPVWIRRARGRVELPGAGVS